MGLDLFVGFCFVLLFAFDLLYCVYLVVVVLYFGFDCFVIGWFTVATVAGCFNSFVLRVYFMLCYY